MKQIKIGFCGTHGSGKTTALYSLASFLKQHHLDVDVVSEVARRCPYPINEQADIKTQIYIFSKMLENEIMPKSEIVLCDRTLLDVYAYTFRVNKDYANSLIWFVLKWIDTYDIIFYLSPKDYDINDGIRSTDKIFRKEIEDIFLNLIRRHSKEGYPLHNKIYFVESQDEINSIALNHIKLVRTVRKFLNTKPIICGFKEGKVRF